MKNVIIVFTLVGLSTACSSQPRPSRDGESCVKTDDCVAPLRCALNHCVGQEEANMLIGWWRKIRFGQVDAQGSLPSIRGAKMPAGDTSMGAPPTGLEDVVIPKNVPKNMKPAAGTPRAQPSGPSGPPPAGTP